MVLTTTNNRLMLKLKSSGMQGIWWHWTALSQEETFRYFLEKAKPKVVLEIGTFQGLTSSLIAEYADVVHTIDVVPYPMQNEVWNYLGVRDKVKNYVCKSTKAKQKLIESLDFDFAFIDGSHLMENIIVDYNFAKKCGHLLFHDYWNIGGDWQDVREFVDSLALPIEVKIPFAYYKGKL